MKIGKPPEVYALCLLTVLRVVKSYIRHPIHCLRIERRELAKFLAYKRFKRKGYTQYFARQLMPLGAIPPDWADLENLYKLIRKLKPKTMLELGGGCSTVISLVAFDENAGENSDLRFATLYSLDESEYWLDQTSSYIPKDMRRFLEQQLVKPRLENIEGTSVSVVDKLPEGEIDFLYIDGCLVPGNSIGADALIVEKKASRNFTILVDGRQGTVNFLKENLKRKYNVVTDPIHSWTIFEST